MFVCIRIVVYAYMCTHIYIYIYICAHRVCVYTVGFIDLFV